MAKKLAGKRDDSRATTGAIPGNSEPNPPGQSCRAGRLALHSRAPMPPPKRVTRPAKTAASSEANSAKYSAKPSPRNGNVLPVGNHPGATGGKKGRSGRKPDEWRAHLATLTSSSAVEAALERVLNDPDHPAFLGAYKYATEQAYQRATQSVTFPQLTPEQLRALPLATLQELREKAGK